MESSHRIVRIYLTIWTNTFVALEKPYKKVSPVVVMNIKLIYLNEQNTRSFYFPYFQWTGSRNQSIE